MDRGGGTEGEMGLKRWLWLKLARIDATEEVSISFGGYL